MTALRDLKRRVRPMDPALVLLSDYSGRFRTTERVSHEHRAAPFLAPLL